MATSLKSKAASTLRKVNVFSAAKGYLKDKGGEIKSKKNLKKIDTHAKNLVRSQELQKATQAYGNPVHTGRGYIGETPVTSMKMKDSGRDPKSGTYHPSWSGASGAKINKGKWFDTPEALKAKWSEGQKALGRKTLTGAQQLRSKNLVKTKAAFALRKAASIKAMHERGMAGPNASK